MKSYNYIYNKNSLFYQCLLITIFFFTASLITNCATLTKNSTLLSIAQNAKLTEIPVKHKYGYSEFSRYRVKSLEIFPYTVQVHSQTEKFVEGSVNFPGRLSLNITTDFSLSKQDTDNKTTLTVDAIAEFAVTRQGILQNSPITVKFYGKTFPNTYTQTNNEINPKTNEYFTIAGIAQENLPELFLSAKKYLTDKHTITIHAEASLFEENKKLAHYAETGFLLYKENTIVGFVNTIGRPRVFVDTSLNREEQNAIITSMIFILIYNRPNNLNKIAFGINFTEEQKEIKSKRSSNIQ